MRFYRFPVLRFEPGLSVVAIAIAVSAAAALIGAQSAVRRVLSLPPAEAMRPEPPARFRAGLLERTRLARWLPTPPRMIWRNVARRPLRAALAVLGIALAVSILVVGRYFVDAIQLLADLQFRTVQREDMTLAFREPLPAKRALRGGVDARRAALRALPDRARAPALRARDAARAADRARADLRAATAGRLGAHRLRAAARGRSCSPPGWPASSASRPETRSRSRCSRASGRCAGSPSPATSTSRSASPPTWTRGRSRACCARTGSISGAFLRVDAAAADELNARLKRLPAVAGATTRLAALQSFESTIAQSFSVFTTVLVLFACAIAAAMVYNAARIALSERGRELASLRVLGFTRREIAVLLLGEQALLTALALPVGFAIGYQMCQLIGRAYQRELFAIPLIVGGRAYLFALTIVLVSAIGSGWLVRRRLDRLDLVAVLKTRE